MSRKLIVLVAAAFMATVTAGPVIAADETEDPTNIIADQIRAQGFKCDSPQGAKRDASASAPDEAVWLLTCEGASYRVRLVPDMAARVERIDQSQSKDQDQSTPADQ